MLVHVFSLQGMNLAVDGESGCVHVVDEVAAALLRSFDRPFSLAEAQAAGAGRFPEKELRDAWQEIEALTREGLLFAPPVTPELLPAAAKPGQNLKALCLHIAHDCNLTCAYCFAAKGTYKTAKKLMPTSVARHALDFLAANSGAKQQLEIDFFGGEPTLNFQTVKDTVAYSREVAERTGKRFNFTITTNATLLDHNLIAYINEHMDNVVLSLDGRPEIHDRLRRSNTGEATYQTILPDALRLVAARGSRSYFIRGTFTAYNPDFVQDVLHLADAGFTEISLEPVVGRGLPLHLNQSHLPAILASYEQLALAYIDRIKQGRPFQFYHFKVALYQGPCLSKRVAACGAGVSYLAVTPEGELYPCHQFVGEAAFKLGSLSAGVVNQALGQQFTQANIFTKAACRACWAKLYCSGGCHANAYYVNQELTQPEDLFCAMQKKRLECALMIEAWKAG